MSIDPSTLGDIVAVSLLANPLPGAGSPMGYPLTVSESLLTVGGRTWAHLTTGGAATLPQGGFFTVTLVDAEQSIHLSSPGVAPVSTTDAGAALPMATPRALTVSEGAAVTAYPSSVRNRRPRPAPRLVTRPVH